MLPFSGNCQHGSHPVRKRPRTPLPREHRREPFQEVAHERHRALSPRQRGVLRLVAQGLTNRAIGRQLLMSASTVNDHLSAIYYTVGVGTCAQSVAVAARQGLL